jgi:hypothetical protein
LRADTFAPSDSKYRDCARQAKGITSTGKAPRVPSRGESLLSSITIKNYGGTCNATTPNWAKPFLESAEPPRPAARAIRSPALDWVPGDEDAASRRDLFAQQQLQEGRLPGAGRPHEEDELSLVDLE